MDITYMHEVLVLAEQLNYTSAAAQLFVSQPTLTRHVNAVEEELGAKLFKRTNHMVELTQSGKVAVKAFQKVVETYDALLADVSSIEDGEESDLRLGMVYYGTTAYYGYPLLEVFTKRYPEVLVSTTTGQTAQVYKMLHRGVIDVALTITSEDYGADVERHVVDTIPLYAFMETDHPLAVRQSVGLNDLARETLVLNTIPVDRPHHVLQMFERHGISPQHVVYLDHIDTLLPTLARTGGVFIGSMLLTAIPQQHHEFVAIEADDFVLDVALVYLKDNENRNIGRLATCIPGIRKPIM